MANKKAIYITDSYTLIVEPFDLDTEKDKARKAVEEAAKAFSAWESMRDLHDVADTLDSHLLYEIADELEGDTE